MLVLLHRGKGGGLSNMFGGGVSSSLGGSAVVEKNLDRLTILCGVVWIVCILALNLLLKQTILARRYPGARRLPGYRTAHSTRRRGAHVAGGNAIRGSRVGAGPMGEAERGEAAPRQRISFFCANGHESRPAFADEAAVPETWDCPRCGFPAGQDKANPPAPDQDRAVQDPPRLRARAAQRRGRRGDPRRGPARSSAASSPAPCAAVR